MLRPCGRLDMLAVLRETPDQPEVQAFLLQADERSASLYPEESRQGLTLSTLLAVDVRFFVARENGRALGCGGYVLLPEGTAEMKRLFVDPAARAKGVGRCIVLAIEHAAAAEGVRTLLLETGIKSFEALRLYSRLGFVERGPVRSILARSVKRVHGEGTRSAPELGPGVTQSAHGAIAATYWRFADEEARGQFMGRASAQPYQCAATAGRPACSWLPALARPHLHLLWPVLRHARSRPGPMTYRRQPNLLLS